MLLPVNGHFNCEDTDCDFTTCNVFDFLQHCGVEFGWEVKLNKRYSFDLFTFLQILSQLVDEGDLDGIFDHVQSATTLMVNASEDDLEDYIEEAVVASELKDIISGAERLLKDHG
jgi:hypothetical protein